MVVPYHHGTLDPGLEPHQSLYVCKSPPRVQEYFSSPTTSALKIVSRYECVSGHEQGLNIPATCECKKFTFFGLQQVGFVCPHPSTSENKGMSRVQTYMNFSVPKTSDCAHLQAATSRIILLVSPPPLNPKPPAQAVRRYVQAVCPSLLHLTGGSV